MRSRLAWITVLSKQQQPYLSYLYNGLGVSQQQVFFFSGAISNGEYIPSELGPKS